MRSEYLKLIWGNIQFFKANMSPLKTVVGLEEEGVFSKDEARGALSSSLDNEGQIEAIFQILCEKENICYVKLIKALKKRHQKRFADALTAGVQHLIDEDEQEGAAALRRTSLKGSTKMAERGRTKTRSTADTPLMKQLAESAREKMELLEKLEEKESEVEQLNAELKNKHEDILWMREELSKKQQSLEELKKKREETVRSKPVRQNSTGEVDKVVADMEIRLQQKDEEISFVIDHIAALTDTVNRLAIEKDKNSSSVRAKRDRSPLPDIVVFDTSQN